MKTSKTPYHHGDLPRALVDTTLQVIREQGITAVTMRGVSERIGVSSMAAYRHFKNKHDLLCAVAEEGFRIIAERYEAALARDLPDPVETLSDLGRIYVGFSLENPALFRLMFGSQLTLRQRRPSLHAMAGRAFSHLPATVARCQAQGLIRPGSSQAVASILWSMMHGLSSLLIDGQLQTEDYEEGFPIFLTANLGKQQKSTGKVLDMAVEVLLHGLVPRFGGPAV